MSENHEISLEDIADAMQIEIVLASSCDSRKKKAKDLKFTPYDTTYRVRYYDNNFETSNSYKNPGDAIKKYNEHTV